MHPHVINLSRLSCLLGYVFSVLKDPEYKAIYWPPANISEPTAGPSGEGCSGNSDVNDGEQQSQHDCELVGVPSFPVPDDQDDVPAATAICHNATAIECLNSIGSGSDILQHDINAVSGNKSGSCSSSVSLTDGKSSSDDEDSDKTNYSSQQEQSLGSSSDSESDSDISFGNLKVYEGCDLSVEEGVCAVMDLFMTHKQTKTTLECVLKLILKFLPEENHMPLSKHLLFKYVHDAGPPVPFQVNYFCDQCLFYISKEEKKCPVCGNEGPVNKFYQLSLAAQIRSL